MPAALNDQWFGNERNLVINCDAEPQIVILAYRQSFVETAERGEEVTPYHHRGWAHQAKLQAGQENIARRFPVDGPWIDPDTVADPYLFGLGNQEFRMQLHKLRLTRQFFRPPEVVRIKKGQQPAAGGARARITGGRNPSVVLGDHSQTCTVPA